MKKVFASLLIAGMAFFCTAEAPVASRSMVRSGNKAVNFYKNGVALVNGKNLRCNSSFNMGTTGGYFTFGSKKATGRSFTYPETGVWVFKATVPANKMGGTMEVSKEVSLTPMGSLEFQITWKSANMRDAKDMFYSFRFPMAHFKGKKVLVGAQEAAVLNQTKYGYYNKSNLISPKLVFYNWDAARRFSVQCEGKVKIVMQSSRDNSYTLRLYPAPGADSLNFTLSFQ